ncbi:F-box/kelch-repeat protein [Abeliophyllum distichum]|uniref:F-box/kelch-repeat protein n=1 Tax=Abeliophyllum distichum TaxID=126358 RepID=A0ABD1T1D8_9LAMI
MASKERTDSIPLPNLSQEIITEILLRLPVKSLVKFRCVSKSWLSLISSTQFAKNHLKISSQKNKGEHDNLVFGYIRDPLVILRSFNLDSFMHDIRSLNAAKVNGFVMDSISLLMVGSCNGLICSSTYGFGFDDLDDDYKVVETCGARSNYEYSAEVKIYSLRKNSWRQIEQWPGYYVSDATSVFAGGAFHWTTIYNGCWHLTSLNLATEMYGEVPLPDNEINMHTALWLGVLRGCLCLVCNFSTHSDVWMMKEYGVRESWTKLICFKDIKDYQYEAQMPLYMSESGIVLMKHGSTLKLYNSNDVTSNGREICSFDSEYEYEAITYMESLVLPDTDNEVNQQWWQWGTKDDDWDFQSICH